MTEKQITKILRIDSSACRSHSMTRQLGNEVVRRLKQAYPNTELIVRDLSDGIDLLDESWVQANLTDPADRNTSQHDVLTGSDLLVRELDSADVILLTAPVYNFSVPAALKAWIDMICRARMTFQYTENGPQGLLKDRPVYLVMASGGVQFGSAVDFASDYLRHIFGFIGIRDIRPVYAEQTNRDASASETAACAMLDQWLPEGAAPAVA
jgi:FMN-dependent NADH-azoreductase